MKRVVIGGFLSVIGTIWSLVFIFMAENNYVGSWRTPPGRLLTSLADLDLVFVFIISVILVIAGLGIMVFELFKKD